jgi:hypothetical protein
LELVKLFSTMLSRSTVAPQTHTSKLIVDFSKVLFATASRMLPFFASDVIFVACF